MRARLGLVLFAAGFVPPLLGLKLPGGLIGGEVELDEKAIVLAVWPWALSVALIVLYVMRRNNYDLEAFCVSALILAAGAGLGIILSHELREGLHTAGLEYSDVLWPWEQTFGLERAAEFPHPIVRAVAVGASVVVGVAGTYALLYGAPLWVAGLVCGALLGRELYRWFPRAEADSAS